MRDPMGLAVSKPSGDILVSDTGNKRILVFNRDGMLIKSIGPLADLRSPIGVAFGSNEEIYVTDMADIPIKHLNASGRLLPPILPDISDLVPFAPGRMCAGYDGKLYISDRAGPRILIMSFAGGKAGQIGQLPGEGIPAWKVQDVAVDEEGLAYILSSQGPVVHVFNRRGKSLRSFGKHGSNAEDFSFPTGICIGPGGNLWIADTFRHDLKVFTPEGDYLFRWGETGTGDGELFYPIDIAFYGRTLYVLEKGSSRLQAFRLLPK
jgi:DNA-binding beta-propeller fold protein YncE